MQRNTKLFLGFLIWIIVFVLLLFLWLRPYKNGPKEFDMLMKNTQKIVVSDAVTEKELETIMGEDEIRAFIESCQITEWESNPKETDQYGNKNKILPFSYPRKERLYIDFYMDADVDNGDRVQIITLADIDLIDFIYYQGEGHKYLLVRVPEGAQAFWQGLYDGGTE